MAAARTRRISPERLAGYGLTLLLGLWVPALAYLLMTGDPFQQGPGLGGDFRFFYVQAAIADRGTFADLYDKARIAAIAQAIAPSADGGFGYPSAYPPILPIAMAPLAALPFGTALIAWTALNVVVYAFSCSLVTRALPTLRAHAGVVAIWAAACPALFFLLAFGQSSAPALLFVTMAALALMRDRRWLAGLALGMLAYKPQLAFGATVVLLLAGQWRTVAGIATSGMLLLAMSWLRVGTDVMLAYGTTLLDTGTLIRELEPKLYHLHSLRGFFSLLLPWPALSFAAYAVAAGIVVAIAVRSWRREAPAAIRISVLLLATVLVDPHLNVYDLVVLVPMFLVLADCLATSTVERPRLALLLAACFLSPLLEPVAAVTHVQLSVVAMGALMVRLARIRA